MPSLNAARREFYDMTADSQLKPYTSWVDLTQHLKHRVVVINFIAAYGTHASITAATSRWPTSARRPRCWCSATATTSTACTIERTFTADDRTASTS